MGTSIDHRPNETSLAGASSHQPSPASRAEDLATGMDSRCVRTERGQYVFRPGAAPSPVERREALRLIDTLRGDLADRASRRATAIGTVVTKLHLAMQKPLLGPEAKAIAEVWTDGLVDVPIAAIDAAYKRFTQGTSGLSRTYMPKVPEFAGLARDIATGWEYAARRLEMLLAREEADPAETPTLSPAGAASLAKLRPALGALR